MDATGLVLALAAGALGVAVGYLTQRHLSERSGQSLQRQAQAFLEEARTKVKESVLEAKEQAHRIREEAESETRRRREDLSRWERKLQERRENLDRRFDQLENRSRQMEAREGKLKVEAEEVDTLLAARRQEVERVAQMTSQEARGILMKEIEGEARQDAVKLIRDIESSARQEAESRAREIITTAIQRLASDQVAEVTVSSVPLPSDEMKGRIIGRKGRNIRAMENATGVDVVVDDTPEAVILSSFDPVRREVARLALSRLVADGRIHPARIEKVVAECKREVEAIIVREGERATHEAGVRGLHPELIKLLGQMKFRTSFGQNVLEHAVQVTHLAAMLAEEVGGDAQTCRAGALLHDIGKAVSHEVDGPHALIGADICRRYGVSEGVCNIIASHHGEEEAKSVEAALVLAADAISGARPGARREDLENYIKRIKALENVASSFEGVEESYAIQAGREIRIVVKPEEVDDLAAIRLSKDIAKKVEQSLQYPGQVKVTVIRETRAVEYAK